MATISAPDLVRQIAGLARSGKLDEAALLAAQVWNAHRNDAVLAALAGAVETHRGQFERAVAYLEVAHRQRPEDLTVRINLAEALFHAGRPADALRLCDEASAREDSSRRLARLGAHLAQEADEYERAIELYRQVLSKDDGDWSLWNNLGNALSGAERYEEAAEALARAAKLAPDAAPIRVNLGNALFEAERFADGEQVLRDAARDFPNDAEPLLALAGFYSLSGNEDGMFEAFKEAARRKPNDAQIQSDLGQEASRRNEFDLAESAFLAALALEPTLGPAIVGLAAVYERTNRETELEPLRERAATMNVDARSIAFIDALRFKRGDRFEEAFAALEQAGDAVVPNRRYQLRGIMLDRLGQYDAAFDEFAQMNASLVTGPGRPLERGANYRDIVAKDFGVLSKEWADGWRPSKVQPLPRAPSFLLGFPRSGTTLLDTMLMAAPETLVLEEERFIAEIEHEIGGIEALPSLDDDAIARARSRYFERVQGLGEVHPGTLIVDKHPLHGNKIPAIQRLFPEARFIFAQRHPCDVLLSCFITNFRTNHAMSNFLELDTAAELYDLTMSYWTKALEIFELPVVTVVYERLVEDTSRELRPLFDWLGLPWPESEFDHREAARARGVVRTASYSQVTEPIYKRAAGRWQRYRKRLEPVFDRIAPWVERFGYSLDDDRIPAWPDHQNEAV